MNESGNGVQLAARLLHSPDSKLASLEMDAEGRQHLTEITSLQEEFEKASGRVLQAQGAVQGNRTWLQTKDTFLSHQKDHVVKGFSGTIHL